MKRLHHLLVRFFAFLALAVAVRAQLVNLATSGTASSSSADYGTIAADGNDGNRDGVYANGSVFHTSNEAAQSFWQVQLPGVRYLDHIRIFNRTDAIQGSVGNFRIIAKNGATTVFNQVFLPSNATDNNNSRAWGTSALRGVQADFVRIERVSQSVPVGKRLFSAALFRSSRRERNTCGSGQPSRNRDAQDFAFPDRENAPSLR